MERKNHIWTRPRFWVILLLVSVVALSAFCLAVIPTSDAGITTGDIRLPQINVTAKLVSLRNTEHGLVLTLRWENRSSQEIHVGSFFHVRPKSETAWLEPSGIQQWSGTYRGPIPAGNTQNREYYLTLHAGVTEANTYLFETVYFGTGDTGNQTNPVQMEFTLEQDFPSPFGTDGVVGLDKTDIYSYASPNNELATLILVPANRRFQFSTSIYNSYLPYGTYTQEGDTLTLQTDDGRYHYVFHDQNGDWVFDADTSSPLPKYTYPDQPTPQVCVPDKAVFQKRGQ